jgi:dephospho-CoA kinase
MLLVGLTGGIGAGKSTVAVMLRDRGAVVIEADDLAREAVEPGSHGYAEVLRAFGPSAVSVTGDLDRGALADRVFADPEARRRLEAIVHPEVARLLHERLVPYRDTDGVVVYAVPLLAENALESMFDVVVTVEADRETRVARLREQRGMDPADAEARIGAQASDEARRAVSHRVLVNDGTPRDLERAVDELWSDLRARATAGSIERP